MAGVRSHGSIGGTSQVGGVTAFRNVMPYTPTVAAATAHSALLITCLLACGAWSCTHTSEPTCGVAAAGHRKRPECPQQPPGTAGSGALGRLWSPRAAG